MKLRSRIRLKLFLQKVLGVGCLLIMLLIAILLQRPIEMLSVVIFFYLYRPLYSKQFHVKSIYLCSLITIVVFTIIALASLELSVSICISCISTFILTLFSYKVRDYMDIKFITNNEMDNRTKITMILNDNTSEEDIIDYCYSHNLSLKVAETTFLFLNNSIEMVAEILEIDNSTVVRRVSKFIKSAK